MYQLRIEQLTIGVERLFCMGRGKEGPVVKPAPSGEFSLQMGKEDVMQMAGEFAAPIAQQIAPQ